MESLPHLRQDKPEQHGRTGQSHLSALNRPDQQAGLRGGAGMPAARGGGKLCLGLVEGRVELMDKEVVSQARKILGDQGT